MELEQLQRAIEAILFAAGERVEASRLAMALAGGERGGEGNGALRFGSDEGVSRIPLRLLLGIGVSLDRGICPRDVPRGTGAGEGGALRDRGRLVRAARLQPSLGRGLCPPGAVFPAVFPREARQMR